VALLGRDESLYVLAALEMQDRGEWQIPSFEGKAFLEKPPMIYCWLRASFRAFGASEVSARLPSAALGVATCVVTYVLAATL
jgi:4-amino-4-deoxy-L-arabinose transferase-like glycosyltransferase